MSLKKFIKKYGSYALGIMALTGGFIVSNMINDNSFKVSATAFDNSNITYNEGMVYESTPTTHLYITTESDTGKFVVAYINDGYYFKLYTHCELLTDEYGTQYLKPSQYYYRGSFSSGDGLGTTSTDWFRIEENSIVYGFNSYSHTGGERTYYPKTQSSTSGGYSEEDLNNKYNEGFEEGTNSVDITEDNQSAINDYILQNNMKTEEEYLQYGEVKFEEGANSIDITEDNQSAINDYILQNNMKTEEEYLQYGEEKYQEGKDENANEYAERLNELDTTISNLNKEIDALNTKINNYESSDDKYQLGFENGTIYGESIGFDKGVQATLSKDMESYGQEQYEKGYNLGVSVGRQQALQEKDEEIDNIEQEKDSLAEQVDLLQNDITNLNNRINTLTGTINNLNGLLDTKYQEGFEAGVDSVDITSDNEEIYNKGYFDGYLQCEIDNPPSVTFPENTYEFGYFEGFSAGVKSVDITIDNQQAIEDYIVAENLKTENEYKLYGEERYKLGYKDNSFGNQVKKLGNNVSTFFINLGKGIVQYVAFGWAWDKTGKFVPNF
ncbi:MAG: hypothetical protein IJW82_04710 [Clostridia bacterium]|nr:hypothetical protein [Clostridia bacterium]